MSKGPRSSWDREADKMDRARNAEWSGVAWTTRMVEGSMRKILANEANNSPAEHNCMTVSSIRRRVILHRGRKIARPWCRS